MFERFTKAARRIVVLAQQESYDRGAVQVGAEHLLIALSADAESVAGTVLRGLGLGPDRVRALVGDLPMTVVSERRIDPAVLATLGIDLDEIRRSVDAEFGDGALDRSRRHRARPYARFSDEAKKLLEVALREAVHRKDSFIGSEHLLLSAVRLPVGAAVVEAGGVNEHQVLEAVAATLSVVARPA